jgi:hypothetical protein
MAAHARLHGGNEVTRPNWFTQEIVAAGVDRVELQVLAVLAGQEHDRGVRERILLADERGQLDAVGAGHVEVHQDQVGPELLQRRHDVERVDHHQRVHAGIAQDALGEQGLAAVVLDDEDAEAFLALRIHQRLQLGEHFAGVHRRHQQRIHAGAARAQAQPDVVGVGQCDQQQALLVAAAARQPDRRRRCSPGAR